MYLLSIFRSTVRQLSDDLFLLHYTIAAGPIFFFPFGEEVGDNQLPPVDDGDSGAIFLDVPIVFYGVSEYVAFVRL